MNRKLKLAQDFLAYHTKHNSVKWEVGFLQQSADAPLSFLKRLHWVKKKMEFGCTWGSLGTSKKYSSEVPLLRSRLLVCVMHCPNKAAVFPVFEHTTQEKAQASLGSQRERRDECKDAEMWHFSFLGKGSPCSSAPWIFPSLTLKQKGGSIVSFSQSFLKRSKQCTLGWMNNGAAPSLWPHVALFTHDTIND